MMKKQYVASERAHLMCPNMHFGMVAEIGKPCSEPQLIDTLNHLAQAHPFLKSVIAREENSGRLYYHPTDHSLIEMTIRENSSSLWEDYKAVSLRDWNVFEEGMLRVMVYPNANGFTAVFAAHHLLVDGRGLLELVQEFANDYTGGIAPVYAEERLIESIDDLPANSRLSGVSKWLVQQSNRQWLKENRSVSYAQYRAFAREYAKTHPLYYNTYTIDRQELSQMAQLGRENGLTMNDLLLAHMYMKTGAAKIIIAADIRSKLPFHQKGSLGNYSTAFGIPFHAKNTNVVEIGKQVHRLVQKHLNSNRSLMLVLACYFEMNPELLDAAAISALGGFESKAGLFVGDRMFGFRNPRSYSLTNLGKVENENLQSLTFIPPSSPASILSLGVVTLNGVLRACTSQTL